jgi:hypothetical protein
MPNTSACNPYRISSLMVASQPSSLILSPSYPASMTSPARHQQKHKHSVSFPFTLAISTTLGFTHPSFWLPICLHPHLSRDVNSFGLWQRVSAVVLERQVKPSGYKSGSMGEVCDDGVPSNSSNQCDQIASAANQKQKCKRSDTYLSIGIRLFANQHVTMRTLNFKLSRTHLRILGLSWRGTRVIMHEAYPRRRQGAVFLSDPARPGWPA